MKGVRKDKVNKLVLAYEPIWAIGTGEVASIENIVEVLDFVKDLVSHHFHLKVVLHIIFIIHPLSFYPL